MKTEDTLQHLTTLFNKLRRGYNFESKDYICHANFKEVEALRNVVEELETKAYYEELNISEMAVMEEKEE